HAPSCQPPATHPPTLSLHDALPISPPLTRSSPRRSSAPPASSPASCGSPWASSTSTTSSPTSSGAWPRSPPEPVRPTGGAGATGRVLAAHRAPPGGPTDVHGRADIVAAMTSDPLAPAASPLAEWPPRSAPHAVILDCDGLLVDPEGQWVALQDEYLARHGTALDAATRRSITGRAADLVVLTLAEAVGKDPHQVGAELLAEHPAHIGEKLTPLPGALETLRAIVAV